MSTTAQGSRSRSNKPGNHASLPFFDQELLAAKNGENVVKFSLAVETSFTDENCEVFGTVKIVDRYMVKIDIGSTDSRRFVWISKALLVAAEVMT